MEGLRRRRARYPVGMRTRLGAAVVIIIAGALLSGCVTTSPPPASGCVPLIVADPKTAAPGDSVTLTSDTVCDAEQPSDGWVIAAATVGARDALVSVKTEEEFDGSFRETIVLPIEFPEGEAYARIDNWDDSPCADNGSCASASVDFVVKR